MKYIVFSNKGLVKELQEKLKLIFLPAGYDGELVSFKESHNEEGKIYYIGIKEEMVVMPYYNKAATKAWKLCLKKQYFSRDLDLKKYQGKDFFLWELFRPEVFKSRTALKKEGHFAMPEAAKEFLKKQDDLKKKESGSTADADLKKGP